MALNIWKPVNLWDTNIPVLATILQYGKVRQVPIESIGTGLSPVKLTTGKLLASTSGAGEPVVYKDKFRTLGPNETLII